ncbi:MAG: HAMP domain-containing histidine kinase [Clostridiales bacterium]|nr:HAMP domain-containing histidine kinase [Clostridiales bacterium]
MKSKFSTIWGAMVITVFLIMLAAGLIMSAIALTIVKLHLISFSRYTTPLIPIFMALLTSLIIGSFIAFLISNKTTKPIIDISNASKEVAKGNFNVMLSEDQRIEEIREMTRNFNKMVRELNGIENLRNDFIVNISHEFNNPLTSIEGYATLLQDTELTAEEHSEYARIILDSVRQLSTLSTNILKLSKLENQVFQESSRNFYLDEQVRQALLLLEPQWTEKSLNLELELTPCEISGPEDLYMQVWMNLLGNAIKFTEANGCISVSLADKGTSAVVSISDTGTGMTEEVRKHIFEKFYQGDPSRSSKGNGLGLSLVKLILEQVNGDISVESQLGKGSTFIVTLPKKTG